MARSRQLNHPAAGPAGYSRGHNRRTVPTTTNGQLARGYQLLPRASTVLIGHFLLAARSSTPVNGLGGRTGGQAVPLTLPVSSRPQLWERLGRPESNPHRTAGGFEGTPSPDACTGRRFEAVRPLRWFRATLDLQWSPTSVFAYHPASTSPHTCTVLRVPEYARALADVRTPGNGCGSASGPRNHDRHRDHGVVRSQVSKHLLHSNQTRGLDTVRDPDVPCIYVKGPRSLIEELGTHLPGEWHPRSVLRKLWGPEPAHGNGGAAFPVLQPDGAWLAHEGRALLPGHMDRRLVGYHGGLDPRELEIPLLVASG